MLSHQTFTAETAVTPFAPFYVHPAQGRFYILGPGTIPEFSWTDRAQAEHAAAVMVEALRHGSFFFDGGTA